MKVLILGAYGMLGHKLLQVLKKNHDVMGTCRQIDHELDFAVAPERLFTGVSADDLSSIERVISQHKPAVILNGIGVVKQRPEASDPVQSIQINSLFPHQLAKLAEKYNSRVIHFSTDCVFSGNKGNYQPNDESDATDLYGRSKFLGELGPSEGLTIRSSIIGPELRNHAGLLDWFVGQRGKTVSGFKKVIWSGFTTREMAKIVELIINDHPDLSGLWQVAMPPISKFDLLSLINDRLNLGITIKPDDNLVCDRSLDGSAFAEKTGFTPPNWSAMIGELAEDCKQYNFK